MRHRGVPIGIIEAIPPGERIPVAVFPLSAYASIQARVRLASVACADAALNQLPGAPALRHAKELSRYLELRDGTGALVPTEYIELTDWPGGVPEISALIGLRESHARQPARAPSHPRSDVDAEFTAV